MALLAAVLDAKVPEAGISEAKVPGAKVPETGMPARARRRLTRRQAIVTGLVAQSANGDLRATKLLFDLVLKAELAAPPPSADEEDPRDFLIRELHRLAAAQTRDPIE